MSRPTDAAFRVLLFALGLFGAVAAPSVVPMGAMVLSALLFAGWEVPLLGLFVDLLWLPAGGFLHPVPLFTLGGIALVWVMEPLRRRFLLQ